MICDPDPLRADGPRFGKPGYMCCGCTTAVDSDCCEILNAAVVFCRTKTEFCTIKADQHFPAAHFAASQVTRTKCRQTRRPCICSGLAVISKSPMQLQLSPQARGRTRPMRRSYLRLWQQQTKCVLLGKPASRRQWHYWLRCLSRSIRGTAAANTSYFTATIQRDR